MSWACSLNSQVGSFFKRALGSPSTLVSLSISQILRVASFPPVAKSLPFGEKRAVHIESLWAYLRSYTKNKLILELNWLYFVLCYKGTGSGWKSLVLMNSFLRLNFEESSFIGDGSWISLFSICECSFLISSPSECYSLTYCSLSADCSTKKLSFSAKVILFGEMTSRELLKPVIARSDLGDEFYGALPNYFVLDRTSFNEPFDL